MAGVGAGSGSSVQHRQGGPGDDRMNGFPSERPVAATAIPPEATPPGSPVPSGPSQQPGRTWPEGSLALAERLHRQLSISDRDWHALKRQRPRRAAEQVAAALVQLLAADDPGATAPTDGRLRAMALLDHAQAWLKAEVSDPGCPSHGR